MFRITFLGARIASAGVSVAGRVVLGTTHAGDYYPHLVPDATRDTHASIKAFMYSLEK